MKKVKKELNDLEQERMSVAKRREGASNYHYICILTIVKTRSRIIIKVMRSCLEQQEIIKKVEGSTPWVSHLIVIQKNGDVRLCVVMKMDKLFIAKNIPVQQLMIWFIH